MKLNFEGRFETNPTSAISAGATTSPLDDIPSVDTPFYLIYDPTNAKGHYESVLVTSKSATNVNHSALTYAHGTDETVRMSTPADALNHFSVAIAQGWIEAADQTWTYASATTFTVSGDQTSIFTKGTKIKLTNDGSTKYFYVTDSSYSDPTTTVTVTGGTDYTLASGAITNPYYSYVDNPQGFPVNSKTFGPLGVSYAEITNTFSVVSSSAITDVTGLTVTVPGGRKIKITAWARELVSNQAAGTVNLYIYEGGTMLAQAQYETPAANQGQQLTCSYITVPSSGSHTYKVAMNGSTANTHQLLASITSPAYISVELV